jgi:hypothetical protein
MQRIATGYCPTLDDECSIQITYLNASTLKKQGFVKSSFRCKHSAYASCHISSCPIFEAAPETLQ